MRNLSMPLLLATAFVAAFTYCEENSANPVEKKQEQPVGTHHCADTVEVYTPQSGDVYTVGDILEIRFCADSGYQTLVAVSFDDEINWHDLGYCCPFEPVDTTARSPEPGVVLWPIPSLVIDSDGEDTLITVSENCRVVAHRKQDTRYKAYSEGKFAIQAGE